MADDQVITSAGDATRVAVAAGALVYILRDDPRVRRAYRQWRVDHGLAGIRKDDLATIRARLLRDKDRDLARLQRLVSDDLRLSYPWLHFALLLDFGAKFVYEELADRPGVFMLDAPEIPGLAKGRAPKSDAEHIGRDVDWYYRAEIKRPTDSIKGLGRQYLEGVDGPRAGDGRATVHAGIGLAKRLLGTLELWPPPAEIG